ncbi:MAG: ComEA family DNA-binding protein [Solirubrobacterales bacterium]
MKKSVYVYVTGEVYHPGVQELAVGERWVTAVGQAEPKRGADLTVINLAAKVQDQQMILVPAVEPVQSGSSGRAGRSRRTGGSNAIMKGPGGSDSVRLNLATAQELDSVLPGIGPELARRIIDYREKHGPFSSVDQLKNVSGIGEKKYGQLKDRVSL